jgi:hypothetical protein
MTETMHTLIEAAGGKLHVALTLSVHYRTVERWAYQNEAPERVRVALRSMAVPPGNPPKQNSTT